MLARHWALLTIVAGATLTVCDFGAFREAEVMRTVPKYLGQAMLLLGVVAHLLLVRLDPRSAPTASEWAWALVFAGPLAAIALGELTSAPHQAMMPLLRWLSAVGLILVVLRLDSEGLQRTLGWLRQAALWISAIGVVFFVLQFDTREKIPLIDLYSTKSIVFEQNIFGIVAYFGLCSWWLSPPPATATRRWVEVAVFTAAGLLSYYKTTIVLGMFIVLLMTFGVYALVAGALLALGVSLYFMDELLLLSQIDVNGVSSGRFELWAIGFDAWQSHLLFGIGESGITPTIARHILRDPPFTTFHSIFVDTMAAGGAVGLFSLALTLAVLIWRLGPRIGQFALVMAPAAFNTFYVGSPNILGLAAILFFHRICMATEQPKGTAHAPSS